MAFMPATERLCCSTSAPHPPALPCCHSVKHSAFGTNVTRIFKAAGLTSVCAFLLEAQHCGLRALVTDALSPAGEGPAGQRVAEGCAAIPGVWHGDREVC